MGFLRRLLYKKRLTKMHFSLRKEDGIKYFQRHIDDRRLEEWKPVVRFCRLRLIRFSLTDDSMERRAGYRERFFREQKGVFGSGIYLCAYCGRPMLSSKTYVDHIIPVQKAGSSAFYGRLLKLRGIKNVNDVRNLAPSCRKCNLHKGSNGGIWVIRGCLERHWIAVLLRETLLLLAGGAALWFWISFLEKTVAPSFVPWLKTLFWG